MILNICFLEIRQIFLNFWAISLQWKNIVIFLFKLQGIHHLSLNQVYYFRKLVLRACISEERVIFLFSSTNEILTFLGSIYRIFDEAIQFCRFFMVWKYDQKSYISSTVDLQKKLLPPPFFPEFIYANSDDKWK